MRFKQLTLDGTCSHSLVQEKLPFCSGDKEISYDCFDCGKNVRYNQLCRNVDIIGAVIPV